MAVTDFLSTVGATDADMERAYGFLLERGASATSREIAAHLIEWRIRAEEKRLKDQVARQMPIYQPKQMYAVGQRIIFSALDDRAGEIVKIRAGENSRLDPFQVIAVQIEGEDKVREFAAVYKVAHPLNEDRAPLLESLIEPSAAIAQYGEQVRARLLQRLSADKEFVHIDDGWFLRGLLPQIHAGHLNLAEAAIEQTGDAQRPGELLKILDLPLEKKSATIFALNHALANDARFDDVGSASDPRWYLTRLEISEARERPAILESAPARALTLPTDLETVATELQDETEMNGEANQRTFPPRDEVTLVLTYPHRRAGTLPLTSAVRGLLPAFSRPRLKINFIDANTGDKFAGYAVAHGQYIAGLSHWFAARKLSPGAFVMLKRGGDALTMVLDYQAQRERALWVRVARGINGKLTFAQERRPLAHKYDEEMLIVVGDPIGIEAAAQAAREQRSLAMLLEEIFPELAKLSGAGRVHAKTLYSAINLIRRAGPRAVLGALIESHALASVGGGYFVLTDEARR